MDVPATLEFFTETYQSAAPATMTMKPNSIPEIFVDFNDVDVDGMVPLVSNGALESIHAQNLTLVDGMEVLLLWDGIAIPGVVREPSTDGWWHAEFSREDLSNSE